MTKILSIDIGIINLALVNVNINDKYEIIDRPIVYLINLLNYNNCHCNLIHSKNISSYMKHLFKEYENIFNDADIILVERQPLVGIKDVEQIINYEYQNKVILISPNSVHSYFGIGDFTYEQRKEFTTNFASSYIPDITNFERKHDIADAYCQLLYYLNLQHKKQIKNNIDNSKFSTDINQFKYNE